MKQNFYFWRLLLLLVARQLFADPLFFDTSRLVEHGFENISSAPCENDNLVIYYENRLYRDELYAAGIAAALVDSALPDSVDFTLVPSRRALPICELRIDRARYKQFVGSAEGAVPDTTFVTVANVRKASPVWFRRFANPSFAKIDLTVYPTFSVYLGNYDDRFKLFFALMPVVSTTLWKGASAYVEASVPLYNDVNYQYFRFIDYPQLSKAAISQIVRLPFNILASVSYGLYNPNRYGWAGEINKRFLQRRLSVGYSFEYTGFLLYYDKEWFKSEKTLLTSKLYAVYYADFLNCQFGLSYNRYVMKDSGWLFEFSRNLRENTVGIFAGSTSIDKFGGMMIRFPLSRQRRTRPRLLRLTMPRYYEYSYRATNKVYTTHSPVQTGISIYTGTKLTYLDLHLTPNYVANNLRQFHKAFQAIQAKPEREASREYLFK